MTNTPQRILLAITGGIAAYKTPDLVRKLKAQGADVRVVMTESATHFVSPLSLQAVSGYPVHTLLIDEQAEAGMGHIALAKWADTLLVAPATANILAKFAHGLADDLLSTLYLATTAQLIIAPAMNQQMWRAPATQRNIQQLLQDGVHIIGPASGEQACGDVGPGRMLEPEEIVEHLFAQHGKPLANKHVVITAGPTREALDPVRYISNYSSGKMGFAIAQACAVLGAKVTLVCGPVSLSTPARCERINVLSAQEMHDAVIKLAPECDIFIASAAVADYRAAEIAENKIKKQSEEDKLTLTLVKNPDILISVALLPSPPFTVGFAAESQHVETYAKNKLKAKGIDMIAANDITADGLGFNSEHNALHVLWANGEAQLPAQPKSSLAEALMAVVLQQFENKNK